MENLPDVLGQGSSTPRATDWYWAIQQKMSLNVMCLNHPKTIPIPLVRGKIVFQDTVPWCQKGWGLLF